MVVFPTPLLRVVMRTQIAIIAKLRTLLGVTAITSANAAASLHKGFPPM
jgi:hypothetical protein